jgi:hypothetical protein
MGWYWGFYQAENFLAASEGRDVDAMRLCEQAIRSARDNAFVHHEAIAYERASDFYRAGRFDQIADLSLRNVCPLGSRRQGSGT